MSDQDKWDRRYSDAPSTAPAPCLLLAEFSHLLPDGGRALELASGLGGNALLLARHGLRTEAWDISSVASDRLTAIAQAQDVEITTAVRDVVQAPPLRESFDVIVVSRFLHRPLCPQLIRALRPGGLLFYQTFTALKTQPEAGPRNPDYLLDAGELLQLFGALQPVYYREEGLLGDTSQGLRNEAQFIGRKS